MCLYPRITKNKKYEPNKKNGGNVPVPLDMRVMATPIGCGECMECRKKEARKWGLRLQEDVRDYRNGKFITLTFSTEALKELTEKIEADKKIYPKPTGYKLDNAIAKKAIRLFNERWRKLKGGKAIRHWLITELGHGETEHLHLHGILYTDETYETIQSKWQYGHIWPKPNSKIKTWVNERTVNYLIKYVKKTDPEHKYYKPIVLTSAGIGNNYTNRYDSKLNKFNENKTKETYTTRTGHEMSLPIYWRNKIYTDEEREKLWIQKIDKNERWVLGEKISVKDGYKEYYEALREAQKQNEKLGYGTGKNNWQQKEYENQRRQAKLDNRINGQATQPYLASADGQSQKHLERSSENWG